MIAWIGLEADMESKKKKISVNWALYLMLVPGFLYMLFNNYIPMTFTVIAFKKFNFQKTRLETRGDCALFYGNSMRKTAGSHIRD